MFDWSDYYWNFWLGFMTRKSFLSRRSTWCVRGGLDLYLFLNNPWSICTHLAFSLYLPGRGHDSGCGSRESSPLGHSWEDFISQDPLGEKRPDLWPGGSRSCCFRIRCLVPIKWHISQIILVIWMVTKIVKWRFLTEMSYVFHNSDNLWYKSSRTSDV